MAATQMTETQAVNLMRNALLVAGHEMGEKGDHWPVIKSTVYQIMKDWEDVQVERNVFEELRKYYATVVTRLDALAERCPEQIRAQAKKIVSDIKETYDACFTQPETTMYVVCDEDAPIHIKRAEMIVDTLGDENGSI